jgi:hypothetical protein
VFLPEGGVEVIVWVILGKRADWMAGQTASVGLTVAVEGGPVALAMAGWGMGISKSRGRVRDGDEEARRLLGEGVV